MESGVMDRKAFGPRSVAALDATICAALIISLWVSFFGSGETYGFYDIDYYRNAVVDVSNGTKSMYDALPYPPFAYLLVWWLAGLPILLGNQIWTGGTILILVALVQVLTLKAARVTAESTNRVWLVSRTSVNVSLLLLTLPIYSQLTNGQLSIVVITLAFIDAAGVIPARFQGVLVGIAGAIKVTPLIFVIYFLVTGQRRQAAIATGSFVAATTLAWGIFPEGSLFFWTHVGQNDQFGNPARVDNLSIRSTLARVSTQLGEMTLVWLALGAIVVAASMWHAHRHFIRGEVVEAVLVVGASATVVAPIAWPHYFTWLPLAALWLIMTGRRRVKFVGFGIILCYSLLMLLPALVANNFEVGATMGFEPTLLVTIPVLIGLFGLPRREPQRLIVPPSGEFADARGNPVP
ncbi:MAG: glycosyltransferase 87 family protein [Propionicimonas sp.]